MPPGVRVSGGVSSACTIHSLPPSPAVIRRYLQFVYSLYLLGAKCISSGKPIDLEAGSRGLAVAVRSSQGSWLSGSLPRLAAAPAARRGLFPARPFGWSDAAATTPGQPRGRYSSCTDMATKEAFCVLVVLVVASLSADLKTNQRVGGGKGGGRRRKKKIQPLERSLALASAACGYRDSAAWTWRARGGCVGIPVSFASCMAHSPFCFVCFFF